MEIEKSKLRIQSSAGRKARSALPAMLSLTHGTALASPAPGHSPTADSQGPPTPCAKPGGPHATPFLQGKEI